MLDTSARLLRLLTLFQTRRFWPGQELAERLEVTGRTLRRDVERLRSLGYPVAATPGVAGGYQLGAGASLPPLQLDDDEALAVSIGLGIITSSTVTGVDEAALRALVKLERVLPSRLRHRASALRAAIQPLARSGPRVESSLLSTLASACSDRVQCRFRYTSKEARATQRTVDPAGLVHTGHRWYLVAWDVDREDWRTFRADRIQGKVTTGQGYSPRPLPNDGDLREYVSQSVAVGTYGHQARLLLHAPLQRARECISPTAGVLEPVDENHCRLTTGAHSLDSLAVFILLMGVDFDVEEPKELLEHLRQVRGRIDHALGGKRRVKASRGN